jgi:hypothetical protein
MHWIATDFNQHRSTDNCSPAKRDELREIALFSPDPPTHESWVHATIATASFATIENLTSGKRYWFRVAAVGTMGQSGWSEPATKIAP